MWQTLGTVFYVQDELADKKFRLKKNFYRYIEQT